MSKKYLNQAITLIALFFWAFVMYNAYTTTLTRARYGIIFLGWCLILYSTSEIVNSLESGDRVDVAIMSFCGIITLIATSYMTYHFEELYTVRIGYAFTHEYVLAVFFLGVITYLSWREFGRVFPIMILGMVIYGYYGSYFPGVFEHGGLTPTRILQTGMLEIEGVYGTITRIVAAWVSLFILYAGLLGGYGAFDIIVRSALYTTKFVRSGVAQTAVIASAIIGSINGSRTANSAMTGSITIPLMKDVGLKPETAAAIEADASSLGQILPPVMGSAGFLMASFLGITYAEVMIGALIPALILVGCVAIAVHYAAISEVPDPSVDVEKLTEGDAIPRRELPAEIVKFGLPFLLLVYLLGIARFTVPSAGFYTVIAMFVTGTGVPVIQSLTGNKKESVRTVLKTTLINTVKGMKNGALIMAPVALIVSAINIVIDLILATGVPSAITLAMLGLSGGIMAIAAIISMMIGVILGLGMPTVAAYTIVAILISPMFINEFGVPAQGAHFFALYAALLSGITPPIASACAVTAGIAGANFMKTCLKAVKLFAPMFIIPVTFLYHPVIVSSTLSLESFFVGSIIFAGAVSIIYGLNHVTPLKRRYELPTRTAYTLLGVVIMTYPNNLIQITLLGVVFIVTVSYQYSLRYRPNFLPQIT